MEGLNGHFSGWKKPSSWDSPESDARIVFIPHCDQWADNEVSSFSDLFQEIISSSRKSNVRWWWGTSEGPPSWANREKCGSQASAQISMGKKTWNMMLSLELVATVWELSDDSLKLPTQIVAAPNHTRILGSTSKDIENRTKGVTLQLYKKIVSPPFKEFAILNSVSQGEHGTKK